MKSPSATGAATWRRAPEVSNVQAIRAMRAVALALGRPVTRLLLWPIALWFVLAAPHARRASRIYLDRALGRRATWIDVLRHFHAFAATVLDRVYLLRERFDDFSIDASGIDAILEPFGRGEGVLACGAHLGSFEALRMIGHDKGLKVAMIMYEANAQRINEALAAIAPGDAVLPVIALGRVDSMLALRRWLDDGGVAGMLADRGLDDLGSRGKGIVVPFLGAPARFPDGPFRLAALLRRKVVFMAGLYRGGNRYDLRFFDLADFSAGAPSVTPAERDAKVRAAVERYAKTIESICRDAPYNWFNFYDFWADASEPTSPS